MFQVPLGSIRAFDVDIGDNARIERLSIDEASGVSITARTLITPAPPFQVPHSSTHWTITSSYPSYIDNTVWISQRAAV